MSKFTFSLWLVLILAATTPLRSQMVSGSEMQNFQSVFRLPDNASKSFSISYQGCDSPSNILFPGEQPEFRFRIHNATNQPIVATGTAELIPYGTKGIPGDIWRPSVFAMGEVKSVPVSINLPASGDQDIKVKFDIPETMGGYAIIFDFGAAGRMFGTTCARTFPPAAGHIPYPKMLLDANVGLDGLDRLGVGTVRREWAFDPGNPGSAAQLDQMMKEFSAHHITVLMVLEAGTSTKQPFGVIGRPYLGDDGVMLGGTGGGGDRVWLPEQDGLFQQSVADMCTKYGWPRGPITAVSLWNEPWEGFSISGWGSDMERYRTLYTAMAKGVEQARGQGTDVLLVGCDSSTNTWDKLFPDGKDDYLKWLDAVTIHYQGIASPSTYKLWHSRTGPHGRVQIWDTESWVANTDDRVATIVATDRAAGYDRSMGVFHGDVTTPCDNNSFHAWALASAVGAAQHFIGERNFKELLFQQGLPWVFVFDGRNGNVDDSSLVIAGDLGEVLGEDAFPFRTTRGLVEVEHKEALRKQLAALPPDSPQRADILAKPSQPEILSGGMLTMPAVPHAQAFDSYGNPLPLVNGQVQVPLDFRGYYMATDGSPGSFTKLLEAVRSAHIDGYEPLNIVAHDALKPLSEGGTFKISLSNILNRPIAGHLQATIPGLQVTAPADLQFAPFETKEISLSVSGELRIDNAYPLRLVFDAGADGKAIHEETLHVNQIAKRTIKVDGDLSDWKDVLPQSVAAQGTGGPTLTEAAWLPFKAFAKDLTAGFATAYLAYDDKYFYFAAKIADNSRDEGTVRFANVDDSSYFYPDISYEIANAKGLSSLESNAGADALRVSATDTQARQGKVWNSGTNDGIGYFIQTPSDKATQVAFYLPPSDSGAVITVSDQQSANKAVQKIGKTSQGVYAVFNLKGSFHVTIRGQDKKPVSVGGIFFDPATTELAQNVSTAFVRTDTKTRGEWPGVYGTKGQWLPGSNPPAPGEINITGGALLAHVWPAGVRHYSYRHDPVLPSGTSPGNDNVQLAFNVLPADAKVTLPSVPGTMPNFVPGQDTDYEFALNQVAPRYGGGTEIWRLRVPGMPTKNFYPREPKSPQDGAVSGGKLVVKYDGNTRIVEAAIPWSEIPEVHAAATSGQTIKFSFRINDNTGVAMELAENRSVSKVNTHTFHAEWNKHWSNEVEFGFHP